MDLMEFYIDEDCSERLDLFLSQELKEVSRTFISRLIKEGLVTINGSQAKGSYLPRQGDLIRVELPKAKKIEIIPKEMNLNIIFEDEDILVVNKPQGMVVHPAPGHTSNTLVNGIIHYDRTIAAAGEALRPGIVHRLDKDTSGVLVVAKNNPAYRSLVGQFKRREVKRIYQALVYGQLNLPQGTINAPIGRHPINRKRMAVVHENSKEAITDYKVLEEYGDYSLLELSLQTGRTHQIRVHMAYLKHPVVGDLTYSKRKNPFPGLGQMLHAKALGFHHPTNKKYLEIQAQLPREFERIIEELEMKR